MFHVKRGGLSGRCGASGYPQLIPRPGFVHSFIHRLLGYPQLFHRLGIRLGISQLLRCPQGYSQDAAAPERATRTRNPQCHNLITELPYIDLASVTR